MTFAEIMQLKGKEAGLSFTAQQLEQFSAYYELLVETNKVMNLTAITEPEEVAVKHMIDSLLAFDEKLFGEKTLADVGTGAGFPGIPLKIYCPSLKVTLIDSLAKRLKFLETVIIELGLKGIRCVHLRAEDAGRDPRHREKYDLVTARAVALKGSKYQEEIAAADKALQILGGRLVSADAVKLPGLNDGRAIVKIAKIKTTPKAYPRKAGLPDKQPLE